MTEENNHTCPVWVGYLMLFPLRKLLQSPKKILTPYIKPGMTVMDVGPAMGFFTLPMAKMVDYNGKVIAADLQPGMLKKLTKRAQRKGVHNIETVLCTRESLNIEKFKEQIDFALLMAVVHEISDTEKFFQQIYTSMKPGGQILIAEPPKHVRLPELEKNLRIAENCGFKIMDDSQLNKKLTVLLKK